MRTVEELCDYLEKALASGVNPIVQFEKGVEELGQEIVLDPGMRARIVGFSLEMEDGDYKTIRITFDTTEFMDFNLPFEQANWYVEAGNSNKLGTARETDNWPDDNRDELWLDGNNDFGDYFTLLTETSHLYEEYKHSGDADTSSYIRWLELQVDWLRQQVNERSS